VSTVLGADQILVLDKGRIVAHGTHAELLEASEIYADIYSSQLVDDAVEQPEAAALREGAVATPADSRRLPPGTSAADGGQAAEAAGARP
jgi:ABC-type multidrug transport system ATPase subunit